MPSNFEAPLLSGTAQPENTVRYAGRFPHAAPGHFRTALDLTVSSLGIGTYLGDPTPAVDAGYTGAVVEAVRSGCNVIDSAINYRMQRSERSVGAALRELVQEGFSRSEVLLCTKGGFLPFDSEHPGGPQKWVEDVLIAPGIVKPDEIVAGCHCMTPAYLHHQVGSSLANLGVESIDVYYVHNPETQLPEVGPDEFYVRLTQAFEALEEEVAQGRISWYGTATWSGYREEPGSPELLSLERVVECARRAGGEKHHFRFIQLPVNLAMPEAFTLANQKHGAGLVSPAEAARAEGLIVVGSGSMLQARLARNLPPQIADRLPGLPSDAARALQFARSAPGITTALVGMSRREHVQENMLLVTVPPLSGS